MVFNLEMRDRWIPPNAVQLDTRIEFELGIKKAEIIQRAYERINYLLQHPEETQGTILTLRKLSELFERTDNLAGLVFHKLDRTRKPLYRIKV